jgi:hypothetical protein
MQNPKRRKARKPIIPIMRLIVPTMAPNPSNPKKPVSVPNAASSNHTTPVKNPRNSSKMLHVE